MLDAVAAAADVPAADRPPGVHAVRAGCPRPPGSRSTGGAAALEAVALEVGRPVRPMLASPGREPGRRARRASARTSRVEYKLDGARIQVHRDGDDVRVWTRTLREVTDGVPELVELVRGAARAAASCSTARPSRWTTTAARARSRRR